MAIETLSFCSIAIKISLLSSFIVLIILIRISSTILSVFSNFMISLDILLTIVTSCIFGINDKTKGMSFKNSVTPLSATDF